jgi:hypothetical protein
MSFFDWFAATGLCVTAEQRYPRGSAGFLVAALSAVTQRDAWPGNWYNCRMEFLGKTTDAAPLGASAVGRRGITVHGPKGRPEKGG